MIDVLVALFFAAWLVASAFWQLQVSWLERFRRWDILGLMPNWTFFAPNPGTVDYHVIYRDEMADGHFGEWAELPLVEERSPLHAIWHPGKRRAKLLSDCVNSIAHLARAYRATGAPDDVWLRRMQLNSPYLLLLNLIVAQPHPFGAQARQFAVVESSGFRPKSEPRPLFRSALHPFAAA